MFCTSISSGACLACPGPFSPSLGLVLADITRVAHNKPAYLAFLVLFLLHFHEYAVGCKHCFYPALMSDKRNVKGGVCVCVCPCACLCVFMCTHVCVHACVCVCVFDVCGWCMHVCVMRVSVCLSVFLFPRAHCFDYKVPSALANPNNFSYPPCLRL